MSRRDTIIVAVLINAGLLIILFASALKSDMPEMASAPVEKKVTDFTASIPKNPEIVRDEVDQLIKQFNSPAVREEPVVVVVPEASEPQAVREAAVSAKPREFPEIRTGLAVSEAAKEDVSSIKVTVRKGDVLEKIARTHGSTVDAIMKANHLPDTRLKIGQLLVIPQKGTATPSKPQEQEVTVKYYTVKQGDNPWTIAVKNHMKVAELLRLNQMDEERARHLKPGDQLRIR